MKFRNVFIIVMCLFILSIVFMVSCSTEKSPESEANPLHSLDMQTFSNVSVNDYELRISVVDSSGQPDTTQHSFHVKGPGYNKCGETIFYDELQLFLVDVGGSGDTCVPAINWNTQYSLYHRNPYAPVAFNIIFHPDSSGNPNTYLTYNAYTKKFTVDTLGDSVNVYLFKNRQEYGCPDVE